MASFSRAGRRPKHLSPTILRGIQPGKYQLHLFKPGFKQIEQEILVKPYEKTSLQIKLEEASKEIAQQQAKFVKRRSHRLASRKFLYIGLGAAALAGTAFFLSEQAYAEAERKQANEYQQAFTMERARELGDEIRDLEDSSAIWNKAGIGLGAAGGAALLTFTWLFFF